MAHLQELSVEECWELAPGNGLARIGWNAPGGPVVIPVNHVVRDDTVWIRTSAHSQLAEQVDESQVAVLVDEIDSETHVGWSVQFKGRAAVLYREEQVPPEVLTLRPWPAEPRPLWIKLAPTEVNGRRLAAE